MAIAFDALLGTVTSSGTLTTSAAAASGSRVFLVSFWSHPTATLSSVSGGGLTWVVDFQYDDSLGTENQMAISSADAPSGLASSTVITPTWSTAPGFFGHAALSWTGVATGASGYLDATGVSASDFNAAWATANIVTSDADSLILGASTIADRNANAANANYTERAQWNSDGSNFTAVVQRDLPAGAGTYNAGGTWSGGTTTFYQMNIGIAYLAAAGEAPPVPSLYQLTSAGMVTR